MRDNLLPFAQILQTMIKADIDNITLYKWCYKHIPKGNPWIKYISKPTHKTKSLNKKKNGRT